jgi:signal transduction histidine kinase
MVDVFADGIHLQQIFINLITNAIQALDSVFDKNARYLVISTKYHKDEDVVAIGFQDTGPSITEEDQKYAFEPFFPVISIRAGMGLALCKDLIDEHAGQLVLKNPNEGGAKFIIILPAARADQVASDIIQ